MEIRALQRRDCKAVQQMMQEFYATPSVSTTGSMRVFARDLKLCVSDDDTLQGFVLAENGTIAGYAMAARGFSTEYGRPCIWLEDLYIAPAYRSRGYGSQFLDFLSHRYPDALLRLEVSPDNTEAIRMYERCGFTPVQYVSMLKRAEQI